MSCNCDKRPIIDATGKSVSAYSELLTPYAGATTNGNAIIAGPIKWSDALEMCNGKGRLRGASVKEFNTALKCDIDIVFAGAGSHTVAINTATGFTDSIADSITLHDAISIVEADYKNKTDYQEAHVDIKSDFTVRNTSTVEGDSRDLWFYLVARAAKTYTSGTRLLVQMSIECD